MIQCFRNIHDFCRPLEFCKNFQYIINQGKVNVSEIIEHLEATIAAGISLRIDQLIQSRTVVKWFVK